MLLALPVISFISGCDAPSAPKERQEFARLSQAIDRVRLADNQAKAAALGALLQEPCAFHCELQTLCGQAYQEHLDAISEVATIRSQLGTASRLGPSQVKALGQALDAADVKLAKAHERALECAGAQSTLER